MIQITEKYRPKGGFGGFIPESDTVAPHQMPPKSSFTLPTDSAREYYDPMRIPDLWAAVAAMDDIGAFRSFGPVGRAQSPKALSAGSEPAQLWQGVIDRLRARDVKDSVAQYIADGDLLITMTDNGLQMHAESLGAWLEATAYNDITAGRIVRECAFCGRGMVAFKPSRKFCSASCRVQDSRRNVKAAG